MPLYGIQELGFESKAWHPGFHCVSSRLQETLI